MKTPPKHVLHMASPSIRPEIHGLQAYSHRRRRVPTQKRLRPLKKIVRITSFPTMVPIARSRSLILPNAQIYLSTDC